MTEWIPVGEKLPLLNENVLAFDSYEGSMAEGHCDHSRKWLVMGMINDNVTYWQPLPPLPMVCEHPECDKVVTYKGTGRRGRFCSEVCRKKDYNSSENGRAVTKIWLNSQSGKESIIRGRWREKCRAAGVEIN